MVPYPLVLVVLAGLALCVLARRRHRAPPPPGPPGYPIIGNVLDMPTIDECHTFAKWRVAYGTFCQSCPLNTLFNLFLSSLGDLISLNCAGTVIVVCNSYQKAVELLDKKSAIYSDRPDAPMATELVGWKNNLAFLPYGKRFREGRKLFHQEFGQPSALVKFQHQQEDESLNLLRRLLDSPREFERSISKYVRILVPELN